MPSLVLYLCLKPPHIITHKRATITSHTCTVSCSQYSRKVYTGWNNHSYATQRLSGSTLSNPKGRGGEECMGRNKNLTADYPFNYLPRITPVISQAWLQEPSSWYPTVVCPHGVTYGGKKPDFPVTPLSSEGVAIHMFTDLKSCGHPLNIKGDSGKLPCPLSLNAGQPLPQ